MRLSLAALISTITLATAQGGAFVSVGEKFSSGGCTPSSLIFADPIFGSGNVCQPLDRSGTGAAIVSYRTLSVSAGCSVRLFTDADCAQGPIDAPVGGCVQGSAAFRSVFVSCV